MRVHDLIGAFYALDNFRLRAVGLREHYAPGAIARAALDDVIAALDRFDAATRAATWGPTKAGPHLVDASR